MADLAEWIRRYVPRDTGLLQENLLKTLQKSELGAYGYEIRLELGADRDVVPYASYVDAMPTERGPWWTRRVRLASGKTRLVRYQPHVRHRTGPPGPDPKAVGHFWGMLQAHAAERTRVRVMDALKAFAPPGTYKAFRQHAKIVTNPGEK